MRILLLSVVACLAFHFAGHSQSLKQVLEAGDESFRIRDYYNAYRCYETILRYAAEGAYKGDTLQVKFSLAEAAQRLNYFTRAKGLYGELIQDAGNADKNIYARSVFNRAKMLQKLAQDSLHYYDEALDTYQFFISEELFRHIEGDDNIKARFKQEAESGILSCDSLQGSRVVRTDSLYRLTGAINSGFSEIAPVLVGNTLYFSSLRFLPETAKKPRQPFYYTKQMKAEFRESTDAETGLQVIDTAVALLPELETYNADELHTMHTAFNRDTSLFFFTQCTQEDGEVFCSMYLRKRLDDGGWGVPQKLPISAVDKEFTTTQPSISYDCGRGREWLYFASDRPGTLGGLDLWRAAIREDGSLGEPENLSSTINTSWNEATPFFHDPSGRLYFSSDAPPSYGGYDIFFSDFQDGAWSVPQNMGIPYNSGYTDQYFFLDPGGEHEYFTSDRPRSFRFVEDLEFCCTDIYTMGNKTGRALEVAVEDCDVNSTSEKTVEIFDLSCGQRTRLGAPRRVKGKGVVSFGLQLYRSYEVVATGESGLSRSRQFDLSERRYIDDDGKISWAPEPFYPTGLEMKVVAVDEASGEILNRVAVTVADPETGAPLPDEGGFVFRIEPDKSYSVGIMASAGPGNEQEGAQAPSVPQNYLPVDTAYRYDLSDPEMMRRLCGKVEFRIPMSPERRTLDLPIVLYFDHDMPLRFNNRADQTRQSFEEAISRYLEQRGNYLQNNNPEEASRVNRFFDREVSGGLSTLENLAGSLLDYVDYMAPGDQLEIQIQGYCSPRGKSSYNRLLSKRRIQCVRSYLESYSKDGRELKNFIGSKIIVKELPLGESRAGSQYPDNDPNSIWGVGPALDRRVEIVNLNTGDSITEASGKSDSEAQEPEKP